MPLFLALRPAVPLRTRTYLAARNILLSPLVARVVQTLPDLVLLRDVCVCVWILLPLGFTEGERSLRLPPPG